LPGAMLPTPLSGTAAANDSELSSIFQPVMSTAAPPTFVASNQSAWTGLLPLAHGATSEMINLPAGPIDPGDPISPASFAAAKAPWMPAVLRAEIAPFDPAALSKVANGERAGDEPNVTPACSAPRLLYTLTASPPALRPTPPPEE